MTVAKLSLVASPTQARAVPFSSALGTMACTCGLVKFSLCMTCRRWGRHYRAVTERRSQAQRHDRG